MTENAVVPETADGPFPTAYGASGPIQVEMHDTLGVIAQAIVSVLLLGALLREQAPQPGVDGKAGATTGPAGRMNMQTRRSIGEPPRLALWVTAVVLAAAEFGLNAVQAVQVKAQVVSLVAGLFELAVPAME